MTTPARLDVSTPGADREQFIRGVADAVNTYDQTHRDDLTAAADVFYDTTSALLARCTSSHDGAQLFLNVLATRGVQRWIAEDGLTLADLRANQRTIAIGVSAVTTTGRSLSVEAMCPVCRHVARLLSANGNDDMDFAHQIFHLVIDEQLYARVVAGLLIVAVDGTITCHQPHQEHTHAS